ncbi:MAG: ABC transporter ATP-binding protein [Chloroflexi bacterium]|nr:ABC transporter ATP-binding protein [Chloroflexota bacterium]
MQAPNSSTTNGLTPVSLLKRLSGILRSALQLTRAVGLVWRGAPWLMAGSLVLVVVQGLLPLATLYLTKLTVDAITAAAGQAALWSKTLPLVLSLGAVALAGTAVAAAASLVRDAQSQAVSDSMAEMVQNKSVEVDLEYYESWQYYDTLHRAQHEGAFRPLQIVSNLTALAQSAISLAGVLGLVLAFSPGIGAAMVAALIPDALIKVHFADRMYQWQRRTTATQREAGYYSWLITSEYTAKEIRLFGLGQLFIQRYRDIRRLIRRQYIDLSLRRALAEFGASAVAVATVYGAFAWVAHQTVQGAISIGSLVIYLAAFQQGRSLLSGTMGALVGLYENNLFLNNLTEFMDLRRRVADPAAPRPMPRPLQQGIEFDHVSFAYPSQEEPVLKDISLSIRPSETIALVGENGSGKTTLVKLLCRLYDPSAGAIRVDGTDLRELKADDLRREIGVIFQDYMHYQLSARENIWVGDVNASPTGERLAEAARAAGADQVVDKLPHGYDTRLGKWFEEGEELSVGQWQKVALARAFFRDAQIVVLDEPTSALDAASEFEVFQRFRDLAGGRTTVLISHRFSTVRMADRIIVLAGGRIAEMGSHDELMQQGGMYARLFEMQAKAYR